MYLPMRSGMPEAISLGTHTHIQSYTHAMGTYLPMRLGMSETVYLYIYIHIHTYTRT